MARPHAPKIDESRRADGTVKYTTRIMVNGERETVRLGDERDGITRQMAERRLTKVLEDIRLGCWEPDDGQVAKREAGRKPEPLFAEAAGGFLAHKRSSQLRDTTIGYLRWALEVHLVPYFGHSRPSRIGEAAVIAYSDHQIARGERIRRLRARGKYLAGPGGAAMRPMSNRSINDTLQVLTELLTWAAGKGWGDRDENPAATWRLTEKQRLTWALEPDELADLMVAAATPRPKRRSCAKLAARGEMIVRLRDEDCLSWKAVAQLACVAESTAIYHYQRAKGQRRIKVDERRAKADEAFVVALACSGARVTELCNLNVEDVDLAHGKFRIEDSKTDEGIREVDMTSGLVAIVAAYFESRAKLLKESDPAFPDGNGKRRTKNQANNQVLAPAVRLADELRAERGARKLPPVTAHVLRHTYITLACEAGYSVPYVMQQVGHRDPRTTMRIYAKVSARRNRATLHATFDRLIGGESAVDS